MRRLDATASPPKPPSRLRPSATASKGTRHSISARDVTAARAHAVVAVPHFDTDRVPAPVFLSACLISEVILLAQLVGDARRRRIEIACVADDLGTPTAVIGHLAQRDDVDSVVAACAARPPARAAAATAPRRRKRPPSSPAAGRKRHRNRNRRARRRTIRVRFLLAVDANRVDEHFALTNLLLQRADVGSARGVVAIRDDQQRLLAMLPALREWNRF